MTITRHFYVLEEVAAALHYACAERRMEEAYFWLAELVDSNEIELAISTLVTTYILHYGTSRLEWLRQAYLAFSGDAVDEDALFGACTALCRFEKGTQDTSFIGLHLLRCLDAKGGTAPDTVTTGQPLGCCLTVEEEYFTRALLQGKVRAAFWAAGLCHPDFVARTLRAATTTSSACCGTMRRHQLLEIIGTLRSWANIEISDQSILLFQLMVMGLREKELSHSMRSCSSEIPMGLRATKQEWESLVGRRGRRLYSPNRSCFYLETRRGRMSYRHSTINELRQLADMREAYPLMMDCRYWSELFDEIQLVYGPCEDAIWEAFCERAFPDDVPDEWSLEDQLKSHGEGMVGGDTNNAHIRKWLRRFNLDTGRYLYGCRTNIQSALALPEAYADRIVPPEEGWNVFEWLTGLCLPVAKPDEESLLPRQITYVTPEAVKEDDALVQLFTSKARISNGIGVGTHNAPNKAMDID